MNKNLRLQTMIVVMLLVTTITINTKAQKNVVVQSTAASTPTANSQDIEPDVTNDGVLQWNIVYYPKYISDYDLNKIKSHFAETLQKVEIADQKSGLDGVPRTIKVLDDGFEVKINRDILTFKLTDLALDLTFGVKEAIANDLTTPVFRIKAGKISENYIVANQKGKGKSGKLYFPDYKIQFNKDISFFFDASNIEYAKKMADELFTIQHKINEKQYKSDLAQFEPLAASYRALKVKPPISEDQRKYIVQANSFNKLKQYTKAIELYNKAIEIDQTAYPAAYLNIALLTAQRHRLELAIFYMKKFLLLEPDSTDARSAQDKIYEWEGLL